MPTNSLVSLRKQMIFAVIPFLNLQAAYQIKKLIKLIVLLIVIYIADLVVSLFVPVPYSLLIDVAIYLILVIHYMRKWTIEWNNKVSTLFPN
jgi:hypothetical protein